MSYVQFQSVGDFIPEPRCSKFAVGLQTSKEWEGVLEARSDSEPSGREWLMLKYALSIEAYALCVRAYQLLIACSVAVEFSRC